MKTRNPSQETPESARRELEVEPVAVGDDASANPRAAVAGRAAPSAASASACCSAAEKETCCDPPQKASCCAPDASACGCT